MLVCLGFLFGEEVVMGTLDGKVAFITGAGSGIGRGVAERLAREGAEICIADIDLEGAERTADLVGQLGGKSSVVKCNVVSESQVNEAARACVANHGRLDIALANLPLQAIKKNSTRLLFEHPIYQDAPLTYFPMISAMLCGLSIGGNNVTNSPSSSIRKI